MEYLVIDTKDQTYRKVSGRKGLEDFTGIKHHQFNNYFYITRKKRPPLKTYVDTRFIVLPIWTEGINKIDIHSGLILTTPYLKSKALGFFESIKNTLCGNVD